MKNAAMKTIILPLATAGLLAAVLLAPTAPVRAAATLDQRFAVLQGLDKITARVMRLEVPVGGTSPFGTLSITVHACRSAPPEETPENAAFLVIQDQVPNEPPQTAFSGWMFSSSPALSAMDHSVYDVWVLRCVAEPEPEEEPEPEPRVRGPIQEDPPIPPRLPAARSGGR